LAKIVSERVPVLACFLNGLEEEAMKKLTFVFAAIAAAALTGANAEPLGVGTSVIQRVPSDADPSRIGRDLSLGCHRRMHSITSASSVSTRSSLWELRVSGVGLRVTRDPRAFDRAFEVRITANELFGEDNHDRILLAPKLLAKSQAISANRSYEEAFRIRAVSSQIGWKETSMADLIKREIPAIELP